MQIAKWIRDQLGRGESEDETSVAAEPETPGEDDERADEPDDDPSVYPLW
jgi:hypothetical protein